MARSLCSFLFVMCLASATSAQSLGAFRWQLQPYCNVVTLTVTQNGGVYTLDGFDDQCGAGARASVAGTAFLNPDGTIGMGLTVVTPPHGTPLHLQISLHPAGLAGSWRDSQGQSGAFAFNPAMPTAGAPRVAPPLNDFADGLVAGQTTFFPHGGFVAQGELNASAPPVSGRGVRAMWLPGKAAFRAGYASGAEWDHDNIGQYSVAMGTLVEAKGTAAIALGDRVGAGSFAVALGSNVSASAYRSLALGQYAAADHAGAIVIGDSSTASGSFLRSTAADQFSVRAAGGYRLFSDATRTAGVTLAPGASAWASVSDVNLKENFRDLDGETVLAKLVLMPIREWNYKAQDDGIRHIGPTAQDFHAAFGLGEDPLRISTIDADGVALAAVQALARENDALKAELAALRERLDRLEAVRR